MLAGRASSFCVILPYPKSAFEQKLAAPSFLREYESSPHARCGAGSANISLDFPPVLPDPSDRGRRSRLLLQAHRNARDAPERSAAILLAPSEADYGNPPRNASLGSAERTSAGNSQNQHRGSCGPLTRSTPLIKMGATKTITRSMMQEAFAHHELQVQRLRRLGVAAVANLSIDAFPR
jgi:hypothetical protein